MVTGSEIFSPIANAGPGVAGASTMSQDVNASVKSRASSARTFWARR